MSGIIDFHSHILPGIDDGSTCVEESVALLREESAQGICHVVATPHFYAHRDSLQEFLVRRDEAEKKLRRELQSLSDIPQISVGAEVLYFSGISEIDDLNELTIRGKKCILIEMPHSPWSEAMYRELEHIYTKRDITPIIAHVDRYITPFRTYGIPERLQDLPVLVQANASFFVNKLTQPLAFRMVKRNQIHLLGSDCHRMEWRPPMLGEAVRIIDRKLGHQMLTEIADFQESAFQE